MTENSGWTWEIFANNSPRFRSANRVKTELVPTKFFRIEEESHHRWGITILCHDSSLIWCVHPRIHYSIKLINKTTWNCAFIAIRDLIRCNSKNLAYWLWSSFSEKAFFVFPIFPLLFCLSSSQIFFQISMCMLCSDASIFLFTSPLTWTLYTFWM